MKLNRKSIAVLIAILLIPTVVWASGQELSWKKLQELVTKAASTISAGDYIPVYDHVTGKVAKVDATLFPVGSSALTLRTGSGTVVSTTTSIAITITGITTASKCLASSNTVATNAVYVRAVVPTTNTATVTTSGDPGTSGTAVSVLCIN